MSKTKDKRQTNIQRILRRTLRLPRVLQQIIEEYERPHMHTFYFNKDPTLLVSNDGRTVTQKGHTYTPIICDLPMSVHGETEFTIECLQRGGLDAIGFVRSGRSTRRNRSRPWSIRERGERMQILRVLEYGPGAIYCEKDMHRSYHQESVQNLSFEKPLVIHCTTNSVSINGQWLLHDSHLHEHFLFVKLHGNSSFIIRR